jgi:type IV pilus assembly protein PilC
MPKFSYAAIDTTGATVEGVLKADTIGTARAALSARELYPIRIREARSRLEIEITTEKLKKKELMHFSRQLSVFVKAGIPIIDALDTIAEEAQDKVLRRVLGDLTDRLRAGSTFTDACAAHPEAFPDFYLGVLRSAELTGNLDATLDDLSRYLERDLEARSRLTSALVYPAVVVVLSLVTVVILAGYVMPQFKKLFADLDSDLPFVTRMLLAIVNFFTELWFIPLGITVLFVGFLVWLFSTDAGHRTRDRLALRLPVIGGIVQYAVLERFCRIFSAMLHAGVTLPEAMRVTTEAAGNTVYREKLEIARVAMVEGQGLARPLAATGLFPGAARQMFKVGEETGTLDEQLQTAALYFDRELDMRIKRFTALFEPMLILIVGLVVGFVAIALVQAMYGVLEGYNS